MNSINKKRVLLISSSGGHWIQLKRLSILFGGYSKYYISTVKSYYQTINDGQFYHVIEASRWNKFKLVWQALSVLLYIVKIRPHVVLTTGAAPGFFALFWAKKMGIKTIWIDSIANVEEMSLSGKKARSHADLWLTQWAHLAKPDGPLYFGSVI